MAAALPEVSEESATGLTAVLYDDIRAVIGVPIVNLIFRHMATIPGCLEWTWATLRPLYLSGAVPAIAESLTVTILPDQAADLSEPISVADLTEEDVDAVARVLDSYGRANPMNAVGLQVVECLLTRTGGSDSPVSALREADLEKPQGLLPLLPMTDPSSAPQRTTTALKRLARQIHGGDTGVIPSLYRHFGSWPVFLEELEKALEPVLAGGIEDAAQEMLAHSRAEAKSLAVKMDVSRPKNADSIAALNRLIAQFPINICRMTVLATLLKRGLKT